MQLLTIKSLDWLGVFYSVKLLELFFGFEKLLKTKMVFKLYRILFFNLATFRCRIHHHRERIILL